MKLAALAILVLTLACATAGHNYDPAQVKKIRPGMTRAQVVQIIGAEPTDVEVEGNQTHLIWAHASATMGSVTSKAVTVTLDKAGLVVGEPTYDQ